MYLENSIEPDNKTERSKAQQMVRRDPHREEDLGERFSQFASAHGTAVGNDLRSDNDTPALNALKALRGALISMSRGEIPVGCCQWPSGYGTFHITHAEALFAGYGEGAYLLRPSYQSVLLSLWRYACESAVCRGGKNFERIAAFLLFES